MDPAASHRDLNRLEPSTVSPESSSTAKRGKTPAKMAAASLSPPEPQAAPGQKETPSKKEELPPPRSGASLDKAQGMVNAWKTQVTTPKLNMGSAVSVSLAQLIPLALQNSKQIRVVQLERDLAYEQITQLDARFDWRVFTEKLWNDVNQPTGSQLQGGVNVTRLKQRSLSGDVGLRRTNRAGGQFEASQNIQLQESNSLFLIPPDQALSTLRLRYNQPLLRNGGRLVNEGQVIVAQFSADAQSGRTQARINEVVFSAVQAYWEIYRRRAEYAIQQELAEQTRKLHLEMQRRSRIDAQKSLIAQTASQLETQLAELATAVANIQRAQHELVRQVGDRNLDAYGELIPVDTLFEAFVDCDVDSAYATAVQNRPELRSALARIKGSEISRNIAVHQLLPQLALILETSSAGVNGDFDFLKSLGDQFSEGRPSYNVGLSLEYPFRNRAAKSQARQSHIALARDIAALEDTIDLIRREVKDSCAALDGYRNQIDNRRKAVLLANVDIDSLLQRRLTYPSDLDQVSQLYVREYLLALQRRATSEQALVNAHVDYAIALIRLRLVAGTILTMDTPIVSAQKTQLP